tara:strand:+ start:104 stop:595 length:492 start_codon:yes stop_codon:yes gene_type:complete
MTYPSAFEKAMKVLFKHEGGYVDDPDDAGGETNFGISKRAYPDINIRGLTKEKAKEIYWKDYWQKGRCDYIPTFLAPIHFDMCVNMGIKAAVKVLQITANHKNPESEQIDVDGGLGKLTIRAITNIEPERVRAFRVMHYARIIERKPRLLKYWYGWFKRSLEV